MKLLSMLKIHDKQDLWDFIKQSFKFGIVGVSNTVVSLGIYYLIIWVDKDLYILGNTLGFFLSVLNAYFWNNKYVFKKTEKGHAKSLIKTYLAYGVSFVLGTALLYILVEYANIPEVIAPFIIMVFTIPLNFLLNKFWAFK